MVALELLQLMVEEYVPVAMQLLPVADKLSLGHLPELPGGDLLGHEVLIIAGAGARVVRIVVVWRF